MGGVENAFVWENYQGWEDARVEIDLASGGIHNGYLACALAFGIPAAALFIYILLSQILTNFRRAVPDMGSSRLLTDIRGFVLANLVSTAVGIYTGTDLNWPFLWFLFGLGVLARTVDKKQHVVEVSNPTQIEGPLAGRIAFSQ